MTLKEKKHLLEIKKRVLIENNLNWLHTKEKAEFAHDEGKLIITKKDLLDIVSEYQEYIKKRQNDRTRRRNSIN